MKYYFPPIFPGKDQTDEFLIIKVMQELAEFGRENIPLSQQALEAVDVLHAAETLVKKFFARNPQFIIEDFFQEVIDKNRERGYYIHQ